MGEGEKQTIGEGGKREGIEEGGGAQEMGGWGGVYLGGRGRDEIMGEVEKGENGVGKNKRGEKVEEDNGSVWCERRWHWRHTPRGEKGERPEPIRG